jgi:Zn-dependent protease/predicted transcriptional regulator
MEKPFPTNIPWSFRIGKLLGIDVYVHFTFILLLGFIGISQWIKTGDMAATLTGLAFIAALFACVVLHEFGHCLTARRYGIVTHDITLLPIGGLARLERMPERPLQELWVALAGPAVNVLIAALIIAGLAATSSFVPTVPSGITGDSFLQQLAAVNLVLALFNLLPAFPMDGGRVLRALLATRLDYVKATGIAARIGQFLAMALGFIGLFSNPFLVFIALFVWIGAEQEYGMVKIKSALTGISAGEIMVTDFQTLRPADTLDVAVSHFLGGFQQDFPVVGCSGETVGMLTRIDLIGTVAKSGTTARVDEVMQREFQAVQVSEPAEAVLTKFQSRDCHALPVVDDGCLVGILTIEKIGEFLAMRSALMNRSGPSLPGSARNPCRDPRHIPPPGCEPIHPARNPEA